MHLPPQSKTSWFHRAASGMAVRRGSIATTAIRVSAQLGAEALRAAEDPAGAAVAAAVTVVVAAMAAAATVADIGRSEGKPCQE